jgi:sigma-E factor negative regulatory protein RseC
MMEEQGTVVAREDGTVWVETTRRSACHGCGQGAGCGTSLLGRLFSSRPNVLALDDPLGVAVGDQVVIGIPDTLLVRASLAAYVLPLVTLVAAAGTAEWLGGADLVVASIAKDDGSSVEISECPNGHGKIKSPMCCGSDMSCTV